MRQPEYGRAGIEPAGAFEHTNLMLHGTVLKNTQRHSPGFNVTDPNRLTTTLQQELATGNILRLGAGINGVDGKHKRYFAAPAP
ncbi:MAG: hypothetical protein A2461_00735 [Burkholderiales bacterium RIFOXYC2_FULL_59_8]|nr:MAG: hypothetical protein A2461_00735 [Burkholderiales bacterium RIFOXYC2_FULL_59_8]